jgi:hypothetical protein
MESMPLPLTDWEDELGRLAAHRLCAQARDELAAGGWDAEDLEAAIERAERRLTGRQRELLWHALTSDPELSDLAASAG